MTWAQLRTRAALGLAPIAVPVSLYVPLGALLGPYGLNVLSRSVLDHLDPVVSIVLGTVGVFVGIAISAQVKGRLRLVVAAAVESSITIAVVSASVGMLLSRWAVPASAAPWALALVLGSCAAASSAGTADSGASSGDRLALIVADLDDVVPVVVGALVLAFIRDNGPSESIQLAETLGVGIAAGLIGWLLFERAEGVGERGVFVLGTLALLGGAAAYLQVSPLLAGMTCGICWRLSPGRADDIVASDLRRYHHPFVLLLLTCAGASMEPRLAAIWLFAPFVLFRLTGKLIGGVVAATLHPAIRADALGAYLIPPGVVGVGLALNFAQADGGAGDLVVTAVAAGAVVFELLAIGAAGTPS